MRFKLFLVILLYYTSRAHIYFNLNGLCGVFLSQNWMSMAIIIVAEVLPVIFNITGRV